MEGPILAEFSSLNALNSQRHRGPQAPSGAPSSAVQRIRGRLGEGAQDSPGKIQWNAEDRARLGESADSLVHLIEDQPLSPKLGISHLLPEASTTEDRDRLLRRLEMCAQACEESTKIMSARYARRDQIKTEYQNDRAVHREKLLCSKRESDERWSRKLGRSPFAVDLVAENQRIDEENRVRDRMDKRRQLAVARQNRDAHNAIFERATAETDEVDQLRAEKRMLLENERKLKALKDVERSNARTAHILQERRKQQVEKQNAQLQHVGASPARTPR